VARTGLQKARRVGKVALSRNDIPGSAGTMGATFGWPSAFQGSGISVLFATRRTIAAPASLPRITAARQLSLPRNSLIRLSKILKAGSAALQSQTHLYNIDAILIGSAQSFHIAHHLNDGLRQSITY
jgi:hypothetical protein